MNEREILEIAKAVGQAEIVPGYKLFTREYLKAGRIIDLDHSHRVEIAKDGIFHNPFIFVAVSEIPNGDPDIAECNNEKNALIVIRNILEEA
jgi:hypothetical protein